MSLVVLHEFGKRIPVFTKARRRLDNTFGLNSNLRLGSLETWVAVSLLFMVTARRVFYPYKYLPALEHERVYVLLFKSQILVLLWSFLAPVVIDIFVINQISALFFEF